MIKIPREISRKISYHGEKTYPEECCGVMFGTERDGVRKVIEIVELHNRQDDHRDTRFLITPDQYREVEKLAREKHLLLLGIYHSHPDHPAEPSQYDLEHAFPWFSYVIQTIEGKHAGVLTTWVLSDDRSRFSQQPVSLEE